MTQFIHVTEFPGDGVAFVQMVPDKALLNSAPTSASFYGLPQATHDVMAVKCTCYYTECICQPLWQCSAHAPNGYYDIRHDGRRPLGHRVQVTNAGHVTR